MLQVQVSMELVTPNVDENHPKVPVSEYNKSKDYCENIIKKYYQDFCSTIIRPATVCGYSPRLRLDLIVNILTNFAYHKNFIKVFGGEHIGLIYILMI